MFFVRGTPISFGGVGGLSLFSSISPASSVVWLLRPPVELASPTSSTTGSVVPPIPLVRSALGLRIASSVLSGRTSSLEPFFSEFRACASAF